MRAYDYLKAREPERAQAFRHRVEHYARDLDVAGLRGRQLSQSYPASLVFRYTLREGLSLLLGLPLALWGLLNHGVPYQLNSLAVRLLRPEADTEATYKLASSIVIFPLCWTAEAYLGWKIGGGWPLAVFLVSLLPTGFFALTWRERLERFRREARGFFQFLLRRDLRHRLLARRRKILQELTELAARVPESVLVGSSPPWGR